MRLGFWVTMIRAVLLLVLGLVLLFYPDKTHTILLNMMGMFWLSAGLVSLRWSLSDKGERGLTLAAGFIGVLVGVGVLARYFTFAVGPDVVVISVIATLVLFTGLLHVFDGFRTVENYGRVWSVESFLLGAVEIGLSIGLYISPAIGSLDYIPISIWALFGGLVLISQALFMREQSRRQVDSPEPL